MKFSLIGTGFIMPRHVEAINYVNGQIVDIVNDFWSSDNWKKIIKKSEPDCIVVLTPNDLHFEMVKMAAEEGKTVLCEKPLAISSKDVGELSNYSNIYTVLQLHHHSEVKKLKEALVDKDLKLFLDENYLKVLSEKLGYNNVEELKKNLEEKPSKK